MVTTCHGRVNFQFLVLLGDLLVHVTIYMYYGNNALDFLSLAHKQTRRVIFTSTSSSIRSTQITFYSALSVEIFPIISTESFHKEAT